MFTYLMNVVVISRLVYLRDGMVGRTTIAVVVVLQTLAVAVLEPSIAVLAYAVLMAGANLLFYRLEQRSSATNGLRVLLLGLQALLTAALSSSAANARFQPWLRATPGFLALYTWHPRASVDLHTGAQRAVCHNRLGSRCKELCTVQTAGGTTVRRVRANRHTPLRARSYSRVSPRSSAGIVIMVRLSFDCRSNP